MNKVLQIALIISSAICLLGCNLESDYQQAAEEKLNSFQQKLNEVKKELDEEYQQRSEQVSTVADAEVKKMHTVEYLVKDLPNDISPEEQTILLNELGLSRWNCFHAVVINKTQRFYCQRRPKSYLRMAGGAVPGLVPIVKEFTTK